MVYYKGKNYVQAFEWFGKAAQNKHEEAQLNLGHMYYKGLGIPKIDKGEAFKWYAKAARGADWVSGHRDAQFMVALMFYKGEEKGNYVDALQWFRKAAKKGHVEGKFYTAVMLENDMGVVNATAAQRLESAMQLYTEAAEKQHAGAQFNLAMMYASANGTPQDYDEALKWLYKAKSNGHVDAEDAIKMIQQFQEGAY